MYLYINHIMSNMQQQQPVLQNNTLPAHDGNIATTTTTGAGGFLANHKYKILIVVTLSIVSFWIWRKMHPVEDKDSGKQKKKVKLMSRKKTQEEEEEEDEEKGGEEEYQLSEVEEEEEEGEDEEEE
jgi:hypothetical protein